MTTMPVFDLAATARYALAFVDAHPYAQLALLGSGLLVALRLAWLAEVRVEREDAERARRVQAIAAAQAQVFRAIRGGRS